MNRNDFLQTLPTCICGAGCYYAMPGCVTISQGIMSGSEWERVVPDALVEIVREAVNYVRVGAAGVSILCKILESEHRGLIVESIKVALEQILIANLGWDEKDFSFSVLSNNSSDSSVTIEIGHNRTETAS